MGILGHLHGTVAAVVILALLFADEAGVPIPFAPNEVLLLLAGVLIQAHALHAPLIYPAALIATAAGTASGYGWARLVGRRGLEALAGRVGAASLLRRVQARLQSAGSPGIFLARMLPGVRPWATLVSGAGGVEAGTFTLGAAPALLIWTWGWLSVGVLVGLPVEHYLGIFQRLITRGAILVVLGALSYAIVRRLRSEGVLALHGAALRVTLVTLLTCGALASIAAGLLSLGRGIAHVRHHGWVDGFAVLAVLLFAGVAALLHRMEAKHSVHAGRT